MLVAMPPVQPPTRGTDSPSPQPRAKRCKALTTSGDRCRRAAVPGMTVCQSHGGGTAASVRSGKRASVSQQAATLWGITTDAGSLSIEEELTKLARNKLTDVIALRIKISQDAVTKHIGTMTESTTDVEYDINGTVQSKEGSQKSRTRRADTSVWVKELHRTEGELVQILKLLHEITGGAEETDTRRIRLQTARETARLLKAFPGLGVDEVAAEVAKRAS